MKVLTHADIDKLSWSELEGIMKSPGFEGRMRRILNLDMVDLGTADFIGSLHRQFKNRGKLSAKQIVAFLRVELRYTPEEIEAALNWNSTYATNPELSEQWRMAIDYYAPTPYWKNITTKGKDPEYVPTIKEFNKLVNNKYFQKVWASFNAEPRFKIGDLVAASSQGKDRNWRGNQGFVIAANHRTPTSALSNAQGAIWYKVLPIGSATPIELEGRELKKGKAA